MPYRDFPLAHAPLTFLIQAGLIRLGGRHFFLQMAWAALAGGVATVLAWRILLRVSRGASAFGRWNWLLAFVLAAPLVPLGIYSVYPYPIYDCDCMLSILIAICLLGRLTAPQVSRIANAPETPGHSPTATGLKTCHPERSAVLRRGVEGSAVAFLIGILPRIQITELVVGAATVLPLFFKQNVGLPFLAAVAGGMFVLVFAGLRPSRSVPAVARSQPLYILAGMAFALLAGAAIVAVTAGLRNYTHWTIQFAAQRRLPGLASMLVVYQQPSFLWTVPSLAAGLLLCHGRFIRQLWARIAASCLIGAPFAGSLILFLLNDDADERADILLALWPLLLLAALVMALLELRRGLTLVRLIPFFVLAAVHGAFLSQQLWGSSYAVWPLLMVLVAGMLAALPPAARPVALSAAALISATFLVCGSLYSASLERLSYVQIPDGPVERSSIPALRGMGTPGSFLSSLAELADFAAREVPPDDPLLLFPGEDPFFFATGRMPHFSVTLFDPATDPYSAAGLMEEARRRKIRWIIVKRALQIKENPMPDREPALDMMKKEFALYRQLKGYDVYRRK
jgi:hypothetical protein